KWGYNKMATEKEPKKIITFLVSECGEFHNYGDFYENIKTIEQAKRLYERIDPDRLSAIPAIGIRIHTEGTPEYKDVEWDFYSGNRIDLDMLEYLPQFTECPEAMAALKQLMDAFPNANICGKLPDVSEPAKEKAFSYGADAFEAHQKKEKSAGSGRETRGKVASTEKKSR
ncbi:MAG: hypothetical protein IJ733_20685, partial [Lachnospiraceae bacterium]|nr:hypothetical protein [Lachnospiraceae bacterium]